MSQPRRQPTVIHIWYVHKSPLLSYSSIAEGAAVHAGIRTANENTLSPIDFDHLATADRLWRGYHAMAEFLQSFNRSSWYTALNLRITLRIEDARLIDRFLRVESKVNYTSEHMRMAEGLIVSAHDAIGEEGPTTLKRQTGHNGVQWTLAWPDRIGMGGIK